MGSSQKRIILRFVSIESRTLSCAVADPREGPGGRPPLFLGQTEVQRTAESFFGDRPPPPPPPTPLSQRLDPDSKIQVDFAWQRNPECGNQGFRILNFRKPSIKNDLNPESKFH